MALEPEQEELLATIIESVRDVPRKDQEWFLSRHLNGETLHGPGGSTVEVLGDDVSYLADVGLLRVTHRDPRHGDFSFRLAPSAQQYYIAMKQRDGEPIARQEVELRRFIDAERFRQSYPNAVARWSEAEALLWSAESEREYTTIGHKAREAMQEFAAELVGRYEPPDVEPNPALVNRRLGAVIAMFLPSLGEARASLLKALGDYSEASLQAIQRQEHGGQKEGHKLTWQDARRVVFHTAAVMHEFAVTLEDAS